MPVFHIFDIALYDHLVVNVNLLKTTSTQTASDKEAVSKELCESVCGELLLTSIRSVGRYHQCELSCPNKVQPSLIAADELTEPVYFGFFGVCKCVSLIS